ncbi:hypothetical protein PQR33_22180 [Paraburkholderia sediminicola]|uniref:hypothetical protein n=1 Tax=Paraburkholderia sediminicola TaxID=458836 RepID=UPI0038BDD385
MANNSLFINENVSGKFTVEPAHSSTPFAHGKYPGRRDCMDEEKSSGKAAPCRSSQAFER